MINSPIQRFRIESTAGTITGSFKQWRVVFTATTTCLVITKVLDSAYINPPAATVLYAGQTLSANNGSISFGNSSSYNPTYSYEFYVFELE